jgi:hypothetical protein
MASRLLVLALVWAAIFAVIAYTGIRTFIEGQVERVRIPFAAAQWNQLENSISEYRRRWRIRLYVIALGGAVLGACIGAILSTLQ